MYDICWCRGDMGLERKICRRIWCWKERFAGGYGVEKERLVVVVRDMELGRKKVVTDMGLKKERFVWERWKNDRRCWHQVNVLESEWLCMKKPNQGKRKPTAFKLVEQEKKNRRKRIRNEWMNETMNDRGMYVYVRIKITWSTGEQNRTQNVHREVFA